MVERQNHPFPAVIDSAGVNKWGIENIVLGFSQHVEYVSSPCKQIAARLLLFITFGPLVNHGESISGEKLFRVHILYLLTKNITRAGLGLASITYQKT